MALNYYQLLGLSDGTDSEHLNAAELKKAYRRALLFFHPDKADPQRKTTQLHAPTVDEISEAYRTLADPVLRSAYNKQLRLESSDDSPVYTRHTGMECVDLEEMDLDDASGAWTRPCRCGSLPAFVVTEDELEKHMDFGELTTGCKGCSLWLKVLFSVAE